MNNISIYHSLIFFLALLQSIEHVMPTLFDHQVTGGGADTLVSTRSCFSSRTSSTPTLAFTDDPNKIIKFVRKVVVTGIVAGYVTSCVKVVTTGDECLVERLGKYNRKLNPGIHWINCPIESISFHATKREQVLDILPQQCYTLDNAPLKADAVVFFKILSLEKAKYEIHDVHEAIMNLCLTQLREEVGKLTLDESFSSRDRINRNLLQNINVVCINWGVEITRIEIQNLHPSPEILAAMELQMAAERKKRATILQSEGEKQKLRNEAEGHAEAVIVEAEAKRKSIILQAHAEAERQRLEAQGLDAAIARITNVIISKRQSSSLTRSTTGAGTSATRHSNSNQQQAIDVALQFIMFIRYMESQAKFASSNSTKVLMFPTKESVPITYAGLQNILN